MKRRFVAIAMIALMGLVPAGKAAADDKDKEDRLQAKPFVFVGTAADCGGPAGSNIVTAAWLRGMGLPDNGGRNSNLVDPRDNPNKTDPHLGRLLSKNGPTVDCSASGAEIKGVRGMGVPTPFILGFDYRNGGHCGGGAPRFNVVVRTAGVETFHFVGNCATDTPAAAVQDPAQWTTIRFGPASQFPPIPSGGTVVSIDLIYDDGTDSTSVPDDAQGVGLPVVDDIFINGRFIRSGEGIAPGDKDRHDDDD